MVCSDSISAQGRLRSTACCNLCRTHVWRLDQNMAPILSHVSARFVFAERAASFTHDRPCQLGNSGCRAEPDVGGLGVAGPPSGTPPHVDLPGSRQLCHSAGGGSPHFLSSRSCPATAVLLWEAARGTARQDVVLAQEASFFLVLTRKTQCAARASSR